jgi:C-terminal processing protease CtpA/Prc
VSVPRTFAGEILQLRGWLRTVGVTGFAGLWLRQDGRSQRVQFDNMADRGLAGTTDWTQYTIALPLDDRADTVALGALLVGEGTIWVDDLELLVDGRPASMAPTFTPATPPSELDTEFDAGSGIDARSLSAADMEHLALLGRVWGFAKYHHPRIRSGEVNWDYELFRVLPSVIDAAGRDAVNAALSRWLAGLNDPASCEPCATPAPQPHLTPDLDWIEDRDLLGDALSEGLQLIYARRPATPEHHYVSFAPGVGNPTFADEATYTGQPLPDPGFRLLALYRFWNIVEYWFPYRDLIDGDWEDVLVEFAPRLIGAETLDEYRLSMIELSARIDDTHANVWAHLDLQPPRGPAELPVVVRFIEGQAVVTGYKDATRGPTTGLRIGDVIDRIDDRPVDDLVSEWGPYYSASNQPARLRDIGRQLTRGEPGSVRIAGSRADGPFDLVAERAVGPAADQAAGRTGDLSGETFQLLSEDVAYLKLSSVVAADVESYLARAAGASVLVVDIRNYPSEFVVFALGGHLVTERTEFARFTTADPRNPGAFLWGPPVALEPLEPTFTGTVVILVNEVSQSQAEYTAMALRASPNALVAGSMTAGADGNVSPVPLPGGISSMISGIGVFYPDRTPTQQIGIVPDLEVLPTIQGVREGRDEVLEAAVSHVLGREFRLREQR